MIADPPGAACTVMPDGNLVGMIVSTPGAVSVRRDFCFSAPGTYGARHCSQSVERIAPVVVTCRKDRYLERQQTLLAADRRVVESEEGASSTLSTMHDMAGALGVGAMFLGPVGVLPARIAVAGLAATNPDQSGLTVYPYAYRALPTMLLVPAAFPPGRACAEFFAAMEDKLRRAAGAWHAFIDRQCIFAPCRAGDDVPCADPECLERHARVDAELRAQLRNWMTCRPVAHRCAHAARTTPARRRLQHPCARASGAPHAPAWSGRRCP